MAETSEVCAHTNVISENGTEICFDCGESLYDQINHDPEWCNYQDQKSGSDLCRVQFRKKHEKGIHQELVKYSFDTSIIDLANKMYLIVTNGGIKRGTSRKAIIFSCVFNAYIELGRKKTSEELRELFKLEKRDASRALTEFKKGYKTRESLFISPEYFIPQILGQFNASTMHVEKIQKLYTFISNKNITGIKGSNPKSISAGIIYYYLFLTEKLMDVDKFSETSGLSKITISKIYKSIIENIDTNEARGILKD
jgi:transcription initiation factor TFIIIB Brf1 subunit/transcription initiation factor TFIIB